MTRNLVLKEMKPLLGVREIYYKLSVKEYDH